MTSSMTLPLMRERRGPIANGGQDENGKRQAKASGTYVRKDNPELQKVVRGLRRFVTSAVPATKETVNSWGVPTFEAKLPYAGYLVGKQHVTFLFHFGTSLRDPEKLLEGTGKNIRHVKLFTPEDLKRRGLRELVRAAARFEDREPMPGMNARRG